MYNKIYANRNKETGDKSDRNKFSQTMFWAFLCKENVNIIIKDPVIAHPGILYAKEL